MSWKSARCAESLVLQALTIPKEVSAANSQAGQAYVDLMSALYHCLGCSFRQQTRNKNPRQKTFWNLYNGLRKKNPTKYHAVLVRNQLQAQFLFLTSRDRPTFTSIIIHFSLSYDKSTASSKANLHRARSSASSFNF
jgi:hypothetical protein